jgi:hypothetical protein
MLGPDQPDFSSTPEGHAYRLEGHWEEYPHWHPLDLYYTVRWIIRRSQRARHGETLETPAYDLPCFASVELDGKGGILLHSVTMGNPWGQELFYALRFLLNDSVHVDCWGNHEPLS